MPRRLRRPKAQLDVEVPGGPSFHPGDNIKVLVSLSAEEAFYVRRGWVELVCVEQHDELVEDREGSHRERIIQQVFCRIEQFLSHTEVPIGIQCRYELSFSLPTDVPPTMKGGIDWHLRALLDIENAGDIHRTGELVVWSWRRPGPP